MPAVPPHVLIACDVFQEEIAALAGEPAPWRRAVWLEMGLHDSPDLLRVRLQKAILEAEDADPGVETILLAYGRCGNGLIGVRAGRCPLVLPRAHDCISVFLGSAERHEAVLRENPAVYFYSPGWIRGKRVPGPDYEAHIRAMYAEQYGDDDEMLYELVEAAREAYAHHTCAAWVSVIDRPEAAAYCRACADFLGWKHRTLAGDPSFLRALLHGPHDPDRFLTVPSGARIGADGEGRLRAE